MKFLRILAVMMIPVFSLLSTAAEANGVKTWHDETVWRLKLALNRMPLHLLPRATELNVKFVITSRGEIRNVSVHSNPSMPALDTWVEKKLESVKSITAPPSGRDERAGFSVKVAVTLE